MTDPVSPRALRPGELAWVVLPKREAGRGLRATVGGVAAPVGPVRNGAASVLVPMVDPGEQSVELLQGGRVIARARVLVGMPAGITLRCAIEGGRARVLAAKRSPGHAGFHMPPPAGVRCLEIVARTEHGTVLHRAKIAYPGDEGIEVFEFEDRKDGAPEAASRVRRVPEGENRIFALRLPDLGPRFTVAFVERAPGPSAPGRSLGEVDVTL
jgi:hypothetical protein